MRLQYSTILFVLFALVSCSGETDTQDLLKIGVAGPHTGDLAAYGIPAVRAMELVVEEFNARSDAGGKRIELVMGDEQCMPDQAVNVAAKMIEVDVIAVVGHICSSATLAAMDVYRHAHMPVISPLSAEPSISLSGENPSFFRTVPHNGAHSRLQAEFLYKQGIRRLAILHDKGNYGKGLAELVKKEAEIRGIEIVLFEGISPGAPDYSAIVLKLAQVLPEAILFGGYHPEAARVLGLMKGQGVDTAFISGTALYDVAFINLAKEHAEGVYVTGLIDFSDQPMGKKAHEQYVAKFNEEPGSYYQSSYAAAQVLIEAIDNSETLNRQTISEALHTGSFQTTLGEITFDEVGDLGGVEVLGVFQVQNGEFIRVY